MSSAPKKEPCKYGAACYRQNPLHFEQFSHPPKRELNTSADEGSSSSSSTPNKKIKGNEQAKSEVKLNLVNIGDIRDEIELFESDVGTIRSDARRLSDQPKQFGFHLTKVRGIHRDCNQLTGGDGGILSVGLKDILNENIGDLVESAQFSYMYDIDWLVEQYPVSWRQCPLYIVHGVKSNFDRILSDSLRPYKQAISCPVLIRDPYGTHHTKMMLFRYSHGLRVVIHTANMIANDWDQKTQGVWISPIFPPLEELPVETKESNFKADLVEYLKNYRSPGINMWIETIRQHNLSSAKVFLIASVPGRHKESARSSYGHLKLRKVLAGSYGPPRRSANWPVICQFSSIGSLGPDPSKWLYGQFISSLAQISAVNAPGELLLPKPPLKCIFPTEENVRLSLEGYVAGANLPYSSQVASRQPYLRAFLHQWRAENVGRTEACPHIKTYCRLSPPDPEDGFSEEGDKMAWFLVTSANLSKAAWGELQMNGSQLAIRSFELGVLFLPKLLCHSDHFTTRIRDRNAPNFLALPYDMPLTPYNAQDEPWTWDTCCVEKPDRHGKLWVPE